MANKWIIPFLVGMMLLTGCSNTILTKYQDQQCVRNCDDKNPKHHQTFEQPVIQTVQMFIGEMGSWIVILGFYLYRLIALRYSDAPLLYRPVNTDEGQEEEEDDDTVRPISSRGAGAASPALKPLYPNADDRAPLEGWKLVLLGLPACCDIAGTTLMNAGLLFVAASIYQMTRGALVLFVGLFSVVFLKRRLFLYHWVSLLIVVLGVALVGLAGAIYSGDKNSQGSKDAELVLHHVLLSVRDAVVVQATDPAVLKTVLGICLIAFAQIFTATQFCLEEWILENYALEPLKVVAWEGLFGFIVTVMAQVILHFTVGISKSGKYGYFDAAEGYRQVLTNRAIGISSLAIMVSIGGFNFFGLSVTRTISATSRSIIDTCRTLFIWIVSLGLGWETFKWLQVVGFALLVYGTFMFNDLIRPPIKALLPGSQGAEERGELLPEEPIEHM
ncbi:Solute carrier family 35 member F6 [Exophiala dermatitidis]